MKLEIRRTVKLLMEVVSAGLAEGNEEEQGKGERGNGERSHIRDCWVMITAIILK